MKIKKRKGGEFCTDSIFYFPFSIFCTRRGAAALPTILVIGAIVLVIGVGAVGTGFVENALTQGDSESKEALRAAEAGVYDATERVVRNKDCNNGGSPSCSSYSFSVGNASVAVTVAGVSSPKTITAAGTYRNKTRVMQAVLALDANSEVTISSWTEIAD